MISVSTGPDDISIWPPALFSPAPLSFLRFAVTIINSLLPNIFIFSVCSSNAVLWRACTTERDERGGKRDEKARRYILYVYASAKGAAEIACHKCIYVDALRVRHSRPPPTEWFRVQRISLAPNWICKNALK